jgi:phosphonate degradation associated HDIG domain protein
MAAGVMNGTGAALPPGGIVALIADIFARRGADSYLGEQVTMSAHMLQAAAMAEGEDAPPELVAAALLHDIGHYTNEFPEDALERGIDNEHETAGARVLAPWFGPEITDPVRLHVAAKRYLCAVDPSYFGRLSPASVHTLGLQGGPMTPSEIAAFEAEPGHRAAVRVRQWDEAAKVVGAPTRDIAYYRPLLERLRRR